MDDILTALYLVVFFGLMGGIAYGIEALLSAHDRGMARVKAYDEREGN
jgi:hypothetical protein